MMMVACVVETIYTPPHFIVRIVLTVPIVQIQIEKMGGWTMRTIKL
jgi:hypothetical protein